jgi:adenylosuccinate lyase
VIRGHSLEVARLIKDEGRPNDLLDRLAADPGLPLDAADLAAVAGDPSRFTGLAERQTLAFLADVLRPRLAPFAESLARGAESRVRV